MGSFSDRTSVMIGILREKRLTLSLAESCTGGMVASEIVSHAGVSDVFKGSAVTYSDSSKTDILGVNKDILSEYGAVSSETAAEMALGAANIFGTDVGASVTGIAGPDGGSDKKPVGLVFMAVTYDGRVRTERYRFEGGRNDIRNRSAEALISLVIEEIG